MTDASGSVRHSVQNATILTTGVLLTERQLQILSSAFPHLAAKLADRTTGDLFQQHNDELPGAVHDGSAQQSGANFCRVLAAARQWLCHSTGSHGPDLRTGFAGIRGKTVFCLQEKQDEENSRHEILAESEL